MILKFRKYNFSSNYDSNDIRKIYFLILISEFYFSLNDGKEYLRENHCLEKNLEKIKFSKEITIENVEEYIRSIVNCHSCLKQYYGLIDSIKENFGLECFIPNNMFIQEIDRGLYKKIALAIIEEIDIVGRTFIGSPINAVGEICNCILDVKEDEVLGDYRFRIGKLALQVGNKKIKVYDTDAEYKDIAELILKIANVEAEIKFENPLTSKIESVDVVAMLPLIRQEKFELDNNLLEYLKWGIPSVRGTFYYNSLAISSAKKRGALILPVGELFKGGADREIRENLLKDGLIEGIILLPNLMLEFSNIALCILIFNKEKRNKEVFFFDARTYFKKIKSRMQIDDEDLKELVNIYNNKEEIKSISKFVTVDKVLKNEAVLNVERYLIDEIEDVNLKKLNEEISYHYEKAIDERKKSDEILSKILKKK